MEAPMLIIIGVVLLCAFMFISLFWSVIKKLFINSFVGLVTLFALHFFLGVKLPMTFATLIIVALFGMAGVGTMLIMHLSGLI